MIERNNLHRAMTGFAVYTVLPVSVPIWFCFGLDGRLALGCTYGNYSLMPVAIFGCSHARGRFTTQGRSILLEVAATSRRSQRGQLPVGSFVTGDLRLLVILNTDSHWGHAVDCLIYFRSSARYA
jgi:hypothetical protein